MTTVPPTGPDNSGVRIFPPAVYLAGLVGGYLVQWLWPVRVAAAPLAVWVRLIGLTLIVVAVVLQASAVMLFRGLGTSLNPTKPSAVLALDGPYRFTRNPMYLGLALLVAGLALLGDALWPLLAVIPCVWIIQTQVIAREEAYLEAKFGSDYRSFRSRVRRWI